MSEKLHSALQDSRALLEGMLHAQVNPDIKRRELRVFGRSAVCYALDGMVSAEMWQRFILLPCLDKAEAEAAGPVLEALEAALPIAEITRSQTVQACVQNILTGKVALLVDGEDEALCLDVRFFVRRGVSPPLTESVLNGPHVGFNESIRDNVTLLRLLLPTPELVSEMTQVGDDIPSSLAILYLNDVVDQDSLRRVKERLEGVHTDHVLSIGALEQLLEDDPYALLPQCCLTERPDRAASFLLEGQVVLVLDGSPQALCMPVSVLHLLHTPDDTSMRWQAGSFLRLIRYLGALCTLLLPGLFVAVVTFHPEALPVTLLTAILESQAAVPLSIPAETLLMLLMFNLIIEAGTRVPGVVGSTLGTVSGLILGQAAVEAKLVHPLLIIVVAVASLGSFAIPDYSLSVAFRMGQLAFLAAGCVFGVYGMVLLLAAAVVRLTGMRSLGSPYAAPVSPSRAHNPDVWMRWPLWQQRWHTWLSNPDHRARTERPMRGWEKQHDKKRR